MKLRFGCFKFRSFVFFLLLSLVGSSASASIVKFKNGEVQEGEVVDNDGRNLYFERDGVISNVDLARVESIDGVAVSVETPAQKEEAKPFNLSFFGTDTEEDLEAIDIPWSQVRAAYASIPHKQATFDPTKTKLDEQSATALNELFRLTDYAVVARVETLQWFQSGGNRGRSFGSYSELVGKILKNINTLELPRKLDKARDLIFESIVEQKDYFEAWDRAKTAGDSFDFAAGKEGWDKHSAVASSHKKLLTAYREIKTTYEDESKRNTEAFFDHLCALDFV